MLAAGDRITAREVAMTSDTGSVRVAGSIVARSAVERGSIALVAGADVAVANGALLDASATDARNQAGGTITLAADGHVSLGSGARVKANGRDESGELRIVAPAVGAEFNLDGVPADLTAVDRVVLVPTTNFAVTAQPDATALGTIDAAMQAYVASARTPVLTRLGLATATNVQFRPAR